MEKWKIGGLDRFILWLDTTLKCGLRRVSAAEVLVQDVDHGP